MLRGGGDLNEINSRPELAKLALADTGTPVNNSQDPLKPDLLLDQNNSQNSTAALDVSTVFDDRLIQVLLKLVKYQNQTNQKLQLQAQQNNRGGLTRSEVLDLIGRQSDSDVRHTSRSISASLEEISGSTITNSTFQGTSVVSDALTVTGNTSLAGASFSGDVTFGNNTLFVDSATKMVGIGTSSPSSPLTIITDVTVPLHIIKHSGFSAQVWLDTYRDSAFASSFHGRHARGTPEAPEAIRGPDHLVRFNGGGYDGEKFVEAAEITMRAAEQWTPEAHGNHMYFQTTRIGETTMGSRMGIDWNGNIRMKSDGSTLGAALSQLDIRNNSGTSILTLGHHSGNPNAANVFLGGVQWYNPDSSGDQPGYVAAINSYTAHPGGHGGYLTFDTHSGSEGGEGSAPIERMRINEIGNVGIGTPTPSAQLHTTGTVRFANFGAGTLTTDASGNLSVSSDERLKTNIGSFTRGLDNIRGLSPISFSWRESSGLDTEHTYYGFSAQNVRDAIPEAVGTDPKGYLTLSDRPILATAVNAIKELDRKIESLYDGLLEWLKDKVLEVRGLKARNVETEVLCVGSTCITENDLKDFLNKKSGIKILEPKIDNLPGDNLSDESGDKLEDKEKDHVQQTNEDKKVDPDIPIENTDIDADKVKKDKGVDPDINPGSTGNKEHENAVE